jgi:hypothetical protein
MASREMNIAMDVYDHATVQDFRQPLERLESAAA